MKKLLLLAVGALSVGYISAVEVPVDQILQEAQKFAKLSKDERMKKIQDIGKKALKSLQKKTYPGDTDISFEIYNKSDKDIYFLVNSDAKDLAADGKPAKEGEAVFLLVEKGEVAQLPIDVSKQTGILIWNPGKEVYEMYLVDPSAQGKTIYVTWDGKKPLRRQTGPGRGLLGITETGFNIKNNVSDKDIKLVSTVEPTASKEAAATDAATEAGPSTAVEPAEGTMRAAVMPRQQPAAIAA